MGELLRSSALRPDHVLCSTAVRARETWKLASKSAKFDGIEEFTDAIYEASYRRLLALVREFPREASIALMVGHNPGFEDLAGHLIAPNGNVGLRLPTAALVCLDFDATDWASVDEGVGMLRWLAVPKMLGD